jgi:hypothetical protein
MFTYIDFHNDTAGLATIGTVCRFVSIFNDHGQTTAKQDGTWVEFLTLEMAIFMWRVFFATEYNCLYLN